MNRRTTGARIATADTMSVSRVFTVPPTVAAGSCVTVVFSVRMSPVTVVPASMASVPPVTTTVSTRAPWRTACPSNTNSVRTSPWIVAVPPVTTTASAVCPAGTVMSPLKAISTRSVRSNPGEAARTAGAAIPRTSAAAATASSKRLISILLGRHRRSFHSDCRAPGLAVIGHEAPTSGAEWTVYHPRHNRTPPPGSARALRVWPSPQTRGT